MEHHEWVENHEKEKLPELGEYWLQHEMGREIKEDFRVSSIAVVTESTLSLFLGKSETAPGWEFLKRNFLFAANKEVTENGFQSRDFPKVNEWVPSV